jgi:hypothetical protein
MKFGMTDVPRVLMSGAAQKKFAEPMYQNKRFA